MNDCPAVTTYFIISGAYLGSGARLEQATFGLWARLATNCYTLTSYVASTLAMISATFYMCFPPQVPHMLDRRFRTQLS